MNEGHMKGDLGEVVHGGLSYFVTFLDIVALLLCVTLVNTCMFGYICVISQNQVWGFPIIYSMSFPSKYHVKRSQTHHVGRK